MGLDAMMFCVSLLLVHTYEDMVLLRRVNSADKKMLESLRSQLMADNMDYEDSTTPASHSGSTSDEHHPLDDVTQIEDHSAISAELHQSSRELLPPPRLHPRVQYAPVIQKHTPRKKRIGHKMKLRVDHSLDPIRPPKHTSSSKDPFQSNYPSSQNGGTFKHSQFRNCNYPNPNGNSFNIQQEPNLNMAFGYQNSGTSIHTSANNYKKDLPSNLNNNPKSELYNQYLQPLKHTSGYHFRAHDYTNVTPKDLHNLKGNQTREVAPYQGPDGSPSNLNDKVSPFNENSELPSQSNAYLSPIRDSSVHSTPSNNLKRDSSNQNHAPSNDNIEPQIPNPKQISDANYQRPSNLNQRVKDTSFPEQETFKQLDSQNGQSQSVDQISGHNGSTKQDSLHKHVKLGHNPYHADPAPVPPPQYRAYRYVPTTRSTTPTTRLTFRMNTLPDEEEPKERTKKSRFSLKRRDDPEDKPSKTFKGFKIVDGMEAVSEHSEEKWEFSDSGSSPRPEEIVEMTVTQDPEAMLRKAVLKAEARIPTRELLVGKDEDNNNDHREEYLRLKYSFGVL